MSGEQEFDLNDRSVKMARKDPSRGDSRNKRKKEAVEASVGIQAELATVFMNANLSDGNPRGYPPSSSASKGSPRKKNRKEKPMHSTLQQQCSYIEQDGLIELEQKEDRAEEPAAGEEEDEACMIDDEGPREESEDEGDAAKTEQKQEEEKSLEDTTNHVLHLLPDEVWLMILSSLSLVEKYRIGLVSHHFWKWSSDRCLYRTLDFSLWAQRIGSFRLTALAAQPRTVNVENLILKGCQNISDADVEFITSKWHKLQHIDLEGCDKVTGYSLQLIHLRCPRLDSLNLIGCDISGFNSVLKLIQGSKRPVELHLASKTSEGISYPKFRSKVSDLDTAITFSNQTEKTVEVVWVDFDGGTRVYHRLPPGKFYSQHTFETHYWLMRDYDRPDQIYLHTVGTAKPHVAEAISPTTVSPSVISNRVRLASAAAPVPMGVPSGRLYSKGNKRSLSISFSNGSEDRTYLVYWIGYEGEEVLKGELPPSEDSRFDSFSSHAWRVRDKLTLDIYAEVVITGDSTVVHL